MFEAISAAGIRDTTDELAKIEPTLQSWRRRCEAQLEMIGVCRSNSVFEMIPPEKPKGISCPFTISENYDTSAYYVTPGCAVYLSAGTSTQPGLRGAFYDPCRLPSAPCQTAGSTISIYSLLVDPQPARLPFDPRAVGARDAIGTWPATFHGLDEDGNKRQILAR